MSKAEWAPGCLINTNILHIYSFLLTANLYIKFNLTVASITVIVLHVLRLASLNTSRNAVAYLNYCTVMD